MKKTFWGLMVSLLLTVFFQPAEIFAESVLQITAEAGVSIWLNKELVGKTTMEQNGLVIADLAPGEYILRAAKNGYYPTETLLAVEDNQTIEWRIQLLKPVMKIEDSVERVESSLIQAKPSGTVMLKSIPLNAEIFFNGESIGKADKKISYVPPAAYSVKFIFQGQELAEKFSLNASETVALTADFTKGEIVKQSHETDSKRGPAVIKMQTSRKRNPALFPHRKHQEMFGCENCHHDMDSDGKQVPYTEGMEIKHCVTCHNQTMQNPRLNNLMLAAHTRCKECHRKIVAESGTAGPIDKCIGCHDTKDEE